MAQTSITSEGRRDDVFVEETEPLQETSDGPVERCWTAEEYDDGEYARQYSVIWWLEGPTPGLYCDCGGPPECVHVQMVQEELERGGLYVNASQPAV